MPRGTSARRKKARKDAAFAASMARIARVRRLAAVAGFVPLVGALLCATGAVPPLCAIPREWYLGLWSAAFGTFVGLSIRMVLERRRYQREGG